MSIESKGAQTFANAEGYGGGFGAAAKRFIYNLATSKTNQKKAKKGTPVTAEDWHNQELANQYEYGRENERVTRDFRFEEQGKNNQMVRDESSKNSQYTRDRGTAADTSRLRRLDLAHAARTGARYTAGEVVVNDGGGFSVSGTNPGAKPLRAAAVAQPSRSTVAKGKQFSATPASTAAPAAPARTPRTPRSTGGTTKPRTPRAPKSDNGNAHLDFPGGLNQSV